MTIKGSNNEFNFVDLSEISLEPPKKKKRYWLWSIKESQYAAWTKCDVYMDEDFKDTKGVCFWDKDANPIKIIKHKEEYIDV